jgi:hypothetical protein
VGDEEAASMGELIITVLVLVAVRPPLSVAT